MRVNDSTTHIVCLLFYHHHMHADPMPNPMHVDVYLFDWQCVTFSSSHVNSKLGLVVEIGGCGQLKEQIGTGMVFIAF